MSGPLFQLVAFGVLFVLACGYVVVLLAHPDGEKGVPRFVLAMACAIALVIGGWVIQAVSDYAHALGGFAK